MHLLPCPSCQDPIRVAPSQAGNEISCPSCSASVTLPRLGDIRSLPLADDSPAAEPTTSVVENSGARQLGTGFFGLIAVAALLITGFCAVRWHLVKVEMTTPLHIAETETLYATLDPARLIREYEDMEKNSIDMPMQFTYKTIELEKRKWGINAVTGGVTTLVTGLIAMLLASTGRRSKSKVDDLA